MSSCFVLVEKEYAHHHSQCSEEDSTSQVNVITNLDMCCIFLDCKMPNLS